MITVAPSFFATGLGHPLLLSNFGPQADGRNPTPARHPLYTNIPTYF